MPWVLDLDGVIWLGAEPIAGAADAVRLLRDAGGAGEQGTPDLEGGGVEGEGGGVAAVAHERVGHELRVVFDFVEGGAAAVGAFVEIHDFVLPDLHDITVVEHSSAHALAALRVGHTAPLEFFRRPADSDTQSEPVPGEADGQGGAAQLGAADLASPVMAAFQLLDTVLVDIETGRGKMLSQLHGEWEPDITQADHRYLCCTHR